MKKVLRTKLVYNCTKTEDFNGEWFTRYDRSYDMVVTASTEEDCRKTMDSFEGAIACVDIQNSFDSNQEPTFDTKKKVWVGKVEVYVGNTYVTDEKEAIKEVYNEWKESLKTPPTPATPPVEKEEPKLPPAKKAKMVDGSIREFRTQEEWEVLQKENWKMLDEQYEQKKQAMAKKVSLIKAYVEHLKTDRKYSSYEIGLVFNRLEEDLEKYGSFLIWKQGASITHDSIDYSEVEKWMLDKKLLNYIYELVEQVEKGDDAPRHKAILIALMTDMVDTKKMSQDQAVKIDERLSLNIFC